MSIHALAFEDEWGQMDAWFRDDPLEEAQGGSELALPYAQRKLNGPAFQALIADAKIELASQLGVPSGDIVIIVRA